MRLKETAAVLVVAGTVLYGCFAPERSPVKEQPPPAWNAVEEAPPPVQQAVEEPEVREAREEPAPPEVNQDKIENKPRFLPARLVVWRALAQPEDLTLVTPRKIKVVPEELTEISFLHPFFDDHDKLKPLVRRVIAKDSKARTFDMRDALVLPAPSQLQASVPSYGRSRLSFSYCVLPGAFPGDESPQINLGLSLEGAVQPLLAEELPFLGSKGCRRWSDAYIALPAGPVGGHRTVTFDVAGTKEVVAPSQAVVIANLSLDVLVTGDTDDQIPAIEKKLGPVHAPNVLVVFIDAARSDCTGPGNRTFPSITPALDKLAEDGVAFGKAFSMSNQTRASIVGMLQSQHPTVGHFHSRWWHIKQHKIDAYYAARPVLITRLANRAGYLSASIGHNHFQYGVTRMGLDPGFDLVYDNRKATGNTEKIIDRALGWLGQNKDSRFFLLVNISPPHQPYTAPAPYQQWTEERLAGVNPKELPARLDYLGEVYFADQEVGRLLAGLQRLDLTRETVILVTADHGETMHPLHHCKSELYKTICHNSHGLTLLDEEIHVPLIWSAPFRSDLKAGMRENHVTHLDVAPTLLDLMGLAPHPRFLGRSLLPDLQGGQVPDAEVYAETRMSSGVRLDGWKFILHHKKDDARTQAWLSGPQGTTQELYDLSADPDETKNLVGKHPVKAQELRASLRRIRNEYKRRAEAAKDAIWHPTPAGDGPPDPGDGPPNPGDAPTPGEAPEPGDGPSSMQQPKDSPSPTTNRAAATTYYLALNGDHKPRQFGGEISVAGRILDAQRLGDHTCLVKKSHQILAVNCQLESATALARLRVSPHDAAVDFRLTMDGAPLPASRFYVGRYGVAVRPQTRLESSEDFSLAFSRSKPHFLPGFDGGLFVWHASPVLAGKRPPPIAGDSPEDSEFDGMEEIHDSGARKVLKNLGYWQ